MTFQAEELAEQDAPVETADPAARPAWKGRFPTSRRMSRRMKWTAIAVAAAILLAGGAALDHALTDPRTSEAYVSLDKVKTVAQTDRDAAESRYQQQKTKYDTLLNGITDRENKVTKRETDVSSAEGALKDAQAAVTKREDAVSAVEKQKAANTAGDGTWVVGKDIEAGTYRASAEVSSSCYWAILQSGTNGSQIIENDLPGGGRPTVVLSGGQDFKSNRCGTWEKQ